MAASSPFLWASSFSLARVRNFFRCEAQSIQQRVHGLAQPQGDQRIRPHLCSGARWIDYDLTLRFTAEVFPRFSSISYSMCCPSLSGFVMLDAFPFPEPVPLWERERWHPLQRRPTMTVRNLITAAALALWFGASPPAAKRWKRRVGGSCFALLPSVWPRARTSIWLVCLAQAKLGCSLWQSESSLLSGMQRSGFGERHRSRRRKAN